MAVDETLAPGAQCAHPNPSKRVGLAAGCFAITFGLCASLPACAAPFTLADALSVAYETNPQLQQQRAQLEALDQGVAEADAGWRPSVNLSGSYGVQRATVSGIASAFNSHPLIGQVTITEPLFRGGRTFAEVGQAMAQVRTGRDQLISAEQSVLLAAVSAYMNVVRDRKNLGVNLQNIQALQSELDAVRTQLAAGAVTRTDALQAEARLARAKADLAVARGQLASSEAGFQNVIGRPAETLEDVSDIPPLPQSEDAALAIALRQHPDLLAARDTMKAADYAVDDAAGALLPQVSISGQYQYLKDAAGTNIFATKSRQQVLSVLGQVTVPIYQGGGDEAAVRRAKDVRRQYELAAVRTERDIRQEVDSAWQALGSAQTAAAANQAQFVADQSAVEGVKQEQEGGERVVLDVLNAQEELFSAQIATVGSHHDSMVAAYRLLAATGSLTARTLGLHVKYYDPQKHFDENADAWFGLGD